MNAPLVVLLSDNFIMTLHSCQFLEIGIRESVYLFNISTIGINMVGSEGGILNFEVSKLLENYISEIANVT